MIIADQKFCLPFFLCTWAHGDAPGQGPHDSALDLCTLFKSYGNCVTDPISK